MKETVISQRDIKAGEPLHKVVRREEDWFYFVAADGSVQRAQRARQRLTPEQRAAKERAHTLAVIAAQKRHDARQKARLEREQAKLAQKQAVAQARQQRLDAQIAALQARKAAVTRR